MSILSPPLLGLGSNFASLSSGFCVRRPRQYNTICWELDLVSRLFVFFLVDCLGGWNQEIWLVSCRRQGMLTQWPAPDRKCKLIISSFITLPHLLDCFIYTRNAMSIVLLLQMMGGLHRCEMVAFYKGAGGGTGGGYHVIVFAFFLQFCILFFHVLCPFILVTRA